MITSLSFLRSVQVLGQPTVPALVSDICFLALCCLHVTSSDLGFQTVFSDCFFAFINSPMFSFMHAACTSSCAAGFYLTGRCDGTGISDTASCARTWVPLVCVFVGFLSLFVVVCRCACLGGVCFGNVNVILGWKCSRNYSPALLPPAYSTCAIQPNLRMLFIPPLDRVPWQPIHHPQPSPVIPFAACRTTCSLNQYLSPACDGTRALP